jgi:alcohol dehydrogenase
MKAAVVPAVSSSWQIKDVPQPQPGPNQVLVKMHASGICYTDVHLTLGHFPGPFPRILGHEPVGEIVAVAPDVTTRKVGDRVGTAWIQSTCGRCEWCQRGRRMFCPYLKGTGMEAQGGHAEYMLMNADATYLIPDKISYEQAAPIFCAGYTVYSGLRWADPQPHERVAVLGIGGLGHLAVQYAKAAGFETIAISHSPDKDKLIRELGADEIVLQWKDPCRSGRCRHHPQHFQFDEGHGGQHSGITARRSADRDGRGRGTTYGLAGRSHHEAHPHHRQPAERPRISLRSS